MANDPESARCSGMPSSGATSRRCLTTRSSKTRSTTPARLSYHRVAAASYSAFADASAGRHDAFTFAIGHCEGKKPDATWACDVIREDQLPSMRAA